MASLNRSSFYGLAGCISLLLLTGCIKMVPPSATGGGGIDNFPRGGGQSSGQGNTGSLVSNNAGSLISDHAASLSGVLRIPGLDLISNNGASLISDAGAGLTGVGGGAFYRFGRGILALDGSPLANAVISLVDSSGVPLSAESVRTDSQGRYTFSKLPTTEGAFFVQADFTGNNKSFSFKSLVGSSSATADIDVASTLVAEKSRLLFQRGSLNPRMLVPQKIQALVDKVRNALVPGLVPYMAGGSRDIISTMDQLALDMPEIQQTAADIAPAAAAPSDTWRVSTYLSADDYLRLGMQSSEEFVHAVGDFDVDKQGNFYFIANPLGSGTGVRIRKLTPDGQVSTYATLPVSPPVKMTFSPDGTLYAAGMLIAERKVVVCRVAESVSVLPGYLLQLNLGESTQGVSGRMAIDKKGDIYAAFESLHMIRRLASGSAEPEVIAGSEGQSGYADGKGSQARFNRPTSTAFGPDGAVYVADYENASIRRVALDGTVSTFAGKPGDSTYRNGRGEYARFGKPQSLVVDADGNCIISDQYSRRVRRISPDGSVFLIAGSGASGQLNGLGPEAKFTAPERLALDGTGNVFIVDRVPGGVLTYYVRKISKD